MLEIITNVAVFGNWKDCYMYMKDENMQSIQVIKTRYCFKDVLGENNYTIKEVAQMAEVIPFD